MAAPGRGEIEATRKALAGSRLEANTVTNQVVSVAANGGPGDPGTRAYGGDDRVAVYYQEEFSGNFPPDYLAKGGVADIISLDDFEGGVR
ncbi:MAG: hypothetical protein JXA13_00935 [Anaerolineales bacterium]|nr:hypothetical protein [Anaerolineales bacterium]